MSFPPILMYHAVARAEQDPNRLCVSPQLFDAQMGYLSRRGLRGVSVGELLESVGLGRSEGLVGLTFDDGYRDFLDTAVPIMERYGFSATVFVVGGRPGGENDWEHAHEPRPPMRLLGPDGIREAAERGMEVGAHSMTHPRLSGLEPDRLEREVGGSRRALGEVLGGEIRGFCYPYGDLDLPAIRAVQRAGYDYACAWKSRVTHDDYDLFRTPVDQQDGMLRFKVKLKIYPQYARVVRRTG
jgi:peptidoglycan/xylan/chitin deacetylase (PgdA/CDA1 family)